MNSDNLVPHWQSQLLQLSNRYPITAGSATQSDMDVCATQFKKLVQEAVCDRSPRVNTPLILFQVSHYRAQSHLQG